MVFFSIAFLSSLLIYLTMQSALEGSSFGVVKTSNRFVIPNTVRYIGCGFMIGCSQLETIILPSSLISIGDNFLFGCPSIKSIVIPDGIEFIGGGFLENCTGLEFVVMRGNVIRKESFPLHGWNRLCMWVWYVLVDILCMLWVCSGCGMCCWIFYVCGGCSMCSMIYYVCGGCSLCW